MTQITVQDGKVVLRDGQVGTEQECCCKLCPCTDVDAADDCGIESISFDIDILFPQCVDTVTTGTIVLPATNDFVTIDEVPGVTGVFIPNEESDCNFRVRANLDCAAAGSSPFGSLVNRWFLSVSFSGGGGDDPDTRCCTWLCFSASVAQPTVSFPLSSQTVEGFCCPAPFDELILDPSNSFFATTGCGDWYVRIYNVNIVYA